MDERREAHADMDEWWLLEWIEFGFSELGSHLAKHAAFEDYYCRRRGRFD